MFVDFSHSGPSWLAFKAEPALTRLDETQLTKYQLILAILGDIN